MGLISPTPGLFGLNPSSDLAAGTSTSIQVGDAATLSDPTQNLNSPDAVCSAVVSALQATGNYSSVSYTYNSASVTDQPYIGSTFSCTFSLVNSSEYDSNTEIVDVQNAFSSVLQGYYTPQDLQVVAGGSASMQSALSGGLGSALFTSIGQAWDNFTSGLESAGITLIVAIVAIVILILVILAYSPRAREVAHTFVP